MKVLAHLFVAALIACHIKASSQVYPDFTKKQIKGKYHANTPEIRSTLFLFEDNTFVHYGCSQSGKSKQQQIWYTAGKWLANKELVMFRSYPDTLNKERFHLELKKNYTEDKRIRKTKELPLQRLEYVNHIFLIEGKNLRDKVSNINYAAAP